jgi:hypothetical protein
MSRVFVNYRRGDSGQYAGLLGDALSSRLGRDRVFLDIATIEPGMDFVSSIRQALDASDVMLVVIGPDWLSPGPDGTSRLENPHDAVRIEIESALRAGKKIVPILVGGAGMPDPRRLPSGLAPLSSYQAVRLDDRTWNTDVERMLEALGGAGASVGRGLWSRIAGRARAVIAPRPAASVAEAPRVVPVPAKQHVVFISHAEEDRSLVERVVADLEAARLHCWVSYRDIPAGEPSWAGAISRAIATSRLLVIVVSRHAMASKQVLREVTIADNENVPFIPFCIDKEPLTSDFKYFFSTSQRLDAGGLSPSEAVNRLRTTVRNHPAAAGP